MSAAHTSKLIQNNNNTQATVTGRHSNYLASSHPNVLLASTAAVSNDVVSPDFNREQVEGMPAAYSQREAISKAEPDFQATAIGHVRHYSNATQGHQGKNTIQHTSVYLQPHLSRKERQGQQQSASELFSLQEGKVQGGAN